MRTALPPAHSLAAILAVIALSFLSLGAAQAAPVDAVVKSVTGSVEAADAGSTAFHSVAAGDKLSAGTTIKTGAGSEAIIVATPGAAVRIDENTTVQVQDMQFTNAADAGDGKLRRKATLDLTSGTVSSLIDHSTPDQTDFVVKTPQGSAAARGTFYGVTVKNGQTFYKVQEGKVGIAANIEPDKKKDDTKDDTKAGAQSTSGKPATSPDNKPPV